MKTQVFVFFNGLTRTYKFDIPLESFLQHWENHMAGQGYFTGIDINGSIVNINPSDCPIVEIAEMEEVVNQ